jgi:hypothetical protein
MRILLTFSGKFGDILWSLPAAREFFRRGHGVDLATMPKYAAIHPLVESQPYINKVFSLPDWSFRDDGCGAQPWEPPSVPPGYDEVHHLTYRARPTMPLIEHAPNFLGIQLGEPVLPFIYVKPVKRDSRLVAYSWRSTTFGGHKQNPFDGIWERNPQIRWVETTGMPFEEAAKVIAGAAMFLGCRSSNYVIAHGVGQRCLTFETITGACEPIFSCPYGTEIMPSIDNIAEYERVIREWTGG